MAEARIEHVEPTTVAFIEMQGPYSRMPEAFRTLYSWVQQHSLVPSGMPRGVFLTDPATTLESESFWELQAPLNGSPPELAPDDTGCGVKQNAPHDDAVALHRGPYDGMEPTYRDLAEWVSEHGYTVIGPPTEVYLSAPSEVAPEDYLTEVRFPVRHDDDAASASLE